MLEHVGELAPMLAWGRGAGGIRCAHGGAYGGGGDGHAVLVSTLTSLPERVCDVTRTQKHSVSLAFNRHGAPTAKTSLLAAVEPSPCALFKFPAGGRVLQGAHVCRL